MMKMTWKRTIALAVGAGMLLTLVACGGGMKKTLTSDKWKSLMSDGSMEFEEKDKGVMYADGNKLHSIILSKINR